MKPLLRWAGGKQWLARRLSGRVPENIGTYYEPFVGGGSLFFRLLPNQAVLADLNIRLMETYSVLRDEPNLLIPLLNRWPNDEQTFYDVRSREYLDRVHRSAQFIFLNRTCWNGLYRVNRAGKFNVPFGRHGRSVFDEDHLADVSMALQTAELYNGDFSTTMQQASTGDFIYLDPPYTKLQGRNGFLKYNQDTFSWDDQRRLARMAVELAERGCHVVVSNVKYDPILKLFPGFLHEVITRHSVLASDPRYRNKTAEYLIYSADSLKPSGGISKAEARLS